MHSIYFFREADAELFTRVKEIGLEIPNSDPLLLDFVPLSANFRTTPALVEQLNVVFDKVFASDDGSGVAFSAAIPARESSEDTRSNLKLHISFAEQVTKYKPINKQQEGAPDPQSEQVDELISLIRSHQPVMEAARAAGQKHRIAVLARARKSLAPIAEALRKAAIPFRAVDLERLADRPEVLDALCLARALLNPHDRVSWLGVLRAPWCGLSLADLHTLTSADDPILLARPIPGLLAERLSQLTPEGRTAANRVLDAIESAPALVRPAHCVSRHQPPTGLAHSRRPRLLRRHRPRQPRPSLELPRPPPRRRARPAKPHPERRARQSHCAPRSRCRPRLRHPAHDHPQIQGPRV